VLRTFVAVELPPDLRTAIGSLIGRLRTDLPNEGLRWSPPENIHVTLKFLGGTGEDQVAELLHALETSLSPLPAFTLRPTGFGTFPPRGTPRVVWIGLSGEIDRLHETVEAVERALHPLGFPQEERAFSPHLTIARSPRSGATRRSTGALAEISKLVPSDLPELRVRRVTLMESKLGQPHSIYSPLGFVPLSG
jgi:RNA 2',3'-cyclic 3'-phosphodiesterase